MALIKTNDPRINVSAESVDLHLVRCGGSNYDPIPIPANSGNSTSNINFDFSPASTSTIVDRRIMLRTYVEFVFNNPHDPSVSPDGAPRQYPVHSVMLDNNFKINGQPLNVSPSAYQSAFMAYGTSKDSRDAYWSTFPSQLDQYQDYDEWKTQGNARNVFCKYGDNSAEQSRGAFPPSFVSGDLKTWRYVFTEPLYMSPLNPKGRDEVGFTNITKLLVSIRLDSDLRRMWSAGATSAITAVAVSFYQVPELLITQITPDLLQAPVPVQNLYYEEPNLYPRLLPVLNANASTGYVASDSLKLSQVPHQIMVFAKRSRQSQTFKTTDTFACLDALRLFWDTRTVLSATTPQQLYHIAVKNGFRGSWGAWSLHYGSPLLINLSDDIGLADGLAPGVLTQATLRVECVFRNSSLAPVEYEFMLIPIYQGIVSITENSCITTLGNLTKDQVLRATVRSPAVSHSELEMEGSGLWGSIKGFFNKLAGGVGSVANVVGQIAPAIGSLGIPMISDVANAVAPVAGVVGDVASAVKSATGGRLRRGGALGGAMGGALGLAYNGGALGGAMSGGGDVGGAFAGGRMRRRRLQ